MDKFRINFVRGQALPQSARRAFAWAAVGYLGLQAAAAALLVMGTISVLAQSQYLQVVIRKKVPGRFSLLAEEMETLHRQATINRARLNTAISALQWQFPIAGKLAALTKTLPPRTWVTDLTADRDRHSITFRARTLVDPTEPAEVPMESWVQALKADPQFSPLLKRVTSGRVSRGRQGKAEYVSFEITAEWQNSREG